MATCPDCGSIIMEGDPYCSHCGAHLVWDFDDEDDDRTDFTLTCPECGLKTVLKAKSVRNAEANFYFGEMIGMIKRTITLIFIALLLLPHTSAYISPEEVDGNLEVPVGGNIFHTATFKNATLLSQNPIDDANFTTANHTYPYKDAYKITCRNGEGKVDYLITWRCDFEAYLDDYAFNDYYNFYSGYLKDNRTPVYMHMADGEVYGIILDTENITYTEEDLLHGILGKNEYALSNATYEVQRDPISFQSHYNGPVIDPYETVRNDPYAYYDYFDYEDNIHLDEYLYDQGYDE